MPLYQVNTKGSDKPRLIDAKSEAAAIKHAADAMFTATLVKSPVVAARLVADGAAIEKAGEPPEPGTRVNVETGMFQTETAGSSAEYADTRPATLAELAEADPGARYRVHVEGGMLQRHIGGEADDDDANWPDIREAAPDELKAAKAKK